MYHVVKANKTALWQLLPLLLLFVFTNKQPCFSQEQMRVQWSTFLGGSGNDETRDLAVDTANNVYVCGIFESVDFPAPRNISEPSDKAGPGYVACFSPLGELKWLAWIQGFRPHKIACSELGLLAIVGNVLVQENTFGGIQPGAPGSSNAGILVMSLNGDRLATQVFGGAEEDIATSLDFYRNSLYVGGITRSTDFPVTPNARQQFIGEGFSGPTICDGFVAKLQVLRTPAGASLVPQIVSYFGGNSTDEILTLRFSPTFGKVYVGGRTRSRIIQNCSSAGGRNALDDGFVARLDSGSISCEWNMLCGGNGNDVVYSVQPVWITTFPSNDPSVTVGVCGKYNRGSFPFPGLENQIPDFPFKGEVCMEETLFTYGFRNLSGDK